MPEHHAPAWQRGLHMAVIVLGLGVALFGVIWLTTGRVTCRGVEMHPGDVCAKSSFTDLATQQTQSFEQRRHAMRQSQPTVIGSGLVLAGFGALMLWRSGRPPVSAEEERLLAHH